MSWGGLYRTLYEGANYRLRTFAGGCWASHCRPASINFLITERCNAHCVHCDIWKNRGKEDTPTVDQLKNTLRELRQWLGPVAITFGGGEALIKPYAVDLVAYASSLGLFIEVLTHGYWDDQGKIEKLAMANPGRITVSFDGLGQTHSKIRGREDFYDRTARSIETLVRLRREKVLGYDIRLKTVIMQHNLDDICKVARFAAEQGVEVFYQPIEQNYNTPNDTKWFEHSENWPKDAEKAVRAVEELIQLKRQGLPITNSFKQLEVMIPYFRDPEGMQVAVQTHVAHETKPVCAALTTLQVQSNGDVTVCSAVAPVGNIKTRPIRRIWEERPHVWDGCCLQRQAAS